MLRLSSALRALLLIYPQPFRERFGPELLDMLAARTRRAGIRRGKAGAAFSFMLDVVDIVGVGALERVGGLFRSPAPGQRARTLRSAGSSKPTPQRVSHVEPTP